MSWEQMDLPLFAEPPLQQQPPPQPRASPRREPDAFDAWVHRRSEFDKAFLRGLRMSSEQTMIDNKKVRAGQPAETNKTTTKKPIIERMDTSSRPAVKIPRR